MDINSIIKFLNDAGLTVERVKKEGLDTNFYNVISNATGAVLERLASANDLNRLVTCMSYVTHRHGREISESFAYIRPVHNEAYGLTKVN